MSEPDLAALLADPRWLPLRYDYRRDEIHFAFLPREQHRAIGFLTQLDAIEPLPRRVVPRRALAGMAIPRAPLHLILHSGLTGSTLFARALDVEGTVFTLKEPPILSDIIGCRVTGAPHDRNGEASEAILALLARPFAPGEAVVIKAGSVGNALGAEILARRPDSRALCLYSPLPVYLASIARRGLWGRVWARKLFTSLRGGRLAELGFSEPDLFEHTDLQIGADAWLALHRILGETLGRHPQRARWIDSEALIGAPAASLRAIAGHFGLALDADAIATGPVFTRHSKTGVPFDAARRAAELATAAEAHREEIALVNDWARKVAEGLGIRWELPSPLAG